MRVELECFELESGGITPTQEERLAALEQRVADMELERLYERRKATESASPEQAYDAKQVNYRLTMLLGIATGQERDVTSIKNDVSRTREQVADVKQDVGIIGEDMNRRFGSLETRFGSLETRFGSLETKFDDHTTLLTQILARLPEKP